MADPTEAEMDHAMSVIEEGVENVGEMAYSCLEIDNVCCWPVGKGQCGRPIGRVALLYGHEHVNAVAFCDHHGECMTAAYKRMRANEKRLSPDEVDALHRKLME